MAQAGYTPISLYYSTTVAAQPVAGNLVAGELALNTADEKLYFKNSSGTVKLLASTASTTNVASISFGTTGLTPNTATTGAITVAGTLAVTNGGTGITSFGTGVATALGQNVTGSGGIVLATSPTLTTPLLGTPTSGTLTNCTGLPLSTGVTGTLGISSGGTGQTTATTAFDALNPMTTLGDIIYEGAGPSATRLGIGTTGQVLTVAGGIPSWATPASGVTTISFGTTGLTPSTATSGAVTVAGTLAVANGGTGVTTSTGSGANVLSTSPTLVTPLLGTPTSGTLTNCSGLPLTTGVTGTLPVANGGTGRTTNTAYAVICGGTTTGGAEQSIASVGTAGQVLTSNGAGALPTFQAAGGGFASGTVMLFGQTAAPTGWTKDTSLYNNSALRVVTGTASTGGSVDFTTAFASQTPTGSVSVDSVSGSAGATTLTTPQIPSHAHRITSPTWGSNGFLSTFTTAGAPGNTTITGSPSAATMNAGTDNTGGSGSHTHPFSFSSGSGTFSGNAINLAVKYVDVIRATKD